MSSTLRYLSVGLILALVFCSFYHLTSSNGLGIGPGDSTYYINAASNFKNGIGLVDNAQKIESHWAPLYPIVLGCFSKIIHQNIYNSAVVLHGILISLFAFVFFVITQSISKSHIQGLLFSLVLICFKPFFIFGHFMSEGLFFVFLALIFLFFITWLNNKKKLYLLILTGCIGGLMLLTRYASAGILLGIGIYLLCQKEKSVVKRINEAILFSFPAFVLFSIWYVYASTFGESAVDRVLEFHMIPFSKVSNFFSTLSSWFANDQFSSAIAICYGIFLVYIIFRNKQKLVIAYQKQQNILTALTAILCAYIFFVGFTILFFDAQCEFDQRMLSPTIPITLIIIFILLKDYQQKLHFYIAIIPFIFLIFNVSAKQWKNVKDGAGYSNSKWKNSQTLNYVIKHSIKNMISNGPDLIMLHFNGHVNMIPRHIDPGSTILNDNFIAQVEDLKNDIKTNSQQLVYFYDIRWRWYLLRKAMIMDEFQEFDCIYFNDGFIIEPPSLQAH